MSWFNFRSKNKQNPAKGITGYAEQDNSGMWLQYFNQLAALSNGELVKFSPENAYRLACSIAEIFIPIDAIADRCASVNYVLKYTKTGEIYEPTGNLKRLMEKPNPFDNLSDIVYKLVFTELSDGNSYAYTKTPKSIVNPTIDNISNIWVLDPETTKPILFREIPNPFLITKKEELIEYYKTFFFINHQIPPRYILHRTVLGVGNNCKGASPLSRVEMNINNILAVYQARYNVYAKNGNGGILSKAPSAQNNNLQEAIDPATRDEILKDLTDRNGLTGNKNFIGLSSVPLQFIKTLGTIQELQPFDETLENAIKIAGAFGVNKELIPKKDNSTFANQREAELSLWQNVVKSYAMDKAKDLTKIYYLPDGVEFEADFSAIEILQEDKKTSYESDGLLIDNLDKLKANGIDVNNAYSNLKDKYNGKK